MLFRNIGLIDHSYDYRENQFVGVKNGRICYIGAAAPDNAADYGEAYDGTGKLLLPALYNAHAHAPMTLLRGYAENVPLQTWLNDLVWPFEAKMNAEDNYWGTLLSCAEMARYGCVSYSDMYYHTPERVQATIEAGMKANLCEGFLAFEPVEFEATPAFAQSEDYFRRFHGCDDGRILMDYSIHAEYTTNPVTCKGVAAAAKEHGARIHMHVSETRSEHEECKQRRNGMTPLQYFESIGVLDVPVLAAHCVWIDDCDLQILKTRDITVAHCPASNMKLGSGFAPSPKLLREGVIMALGTDGMASNNNHDLFQDMYLMSILEKGFRMDPTSVLPQEALFCATRGGALAQGREDCGLLKEGFKADLCVLDVTGPSYAPMFDALRNVVYAGHGSDVVLTMCDGRVIYRDGETIGVDVERAKHEVGERTRRIISEL